MDSKAIKELMEAYQQVYASPEEIDELYKGKHGQSETEYQDSRSNAGKMVSGTSKLSGAAYSSRGIKNTGPNPAGGSKKPQGQGRMTSGQRTELEYRKANLKKEEVEQIDEISADLALKASKAADIKRGKLSVAGDKPGAAKKAAQASRLYAKQAKIRLNREEVELDIFDVVLEFLQTEGYAETLEEAEWMMANLIDDEAIGIILGEEQLDEVSDRLAKAARNTRERRYNASFGDGGMSRNYIKQNAKKDMLNKTLASRAARTGSKIKPVEEDYVNEAQHARENPEKYEREQAKKSAPVRGERTPMPPRGDKRREDFEKWYAANVR